MDLNEEIEYWKEKYRLSRLDNQIQQENEQRMQKFKMVPIIEQLLEFLIIDGNDIDGGKYSEETMKKLLASQIAITKAKVNEQLGVEYFEKGN